MRSIDFQFVADQQQADSLVETRLGVPEDADQIVRINEYWSAAHEAGNTHSGFHRHRFSASEICAIASKDEIVVATSHALVVGYYLINTLVDSESLRMRAKTVDGLVRAGRLVEGRYAYQAQVGVAHTHIKQGIGRGLLSLLKERVRDRYDYLIGVVYDNNNAGMIANTRSGWSKIERLRDGWLVMTPTGRDP